MDTKRIDGLLEELINEISAYVKENILQYETKPVKHLIWAEHYLSTAKMNIERAIERLKKFSLTQQGKRGV